MVEKVGGFIPPEQLERHAEEFLREYHPTLALPVPIEEIVEFRVRLEVLALPGLEKGFGVESFLTKSGTAIVVDERQMLRQEQRYRFSLAHEIGHWILHRGLYAGATIEGLEEYLAFYASLEDAAIEAMEFQARNLGGRILLPRDPFLVQARVVLPGLLAKLPASPSTELVCKGLAKLLAEKFNVHTQVIETRLIGDGLCLELGMKKPPRKRA